jgi:hypothetical protein
VTDETSIADRDQFTHETMRLNPAITTDSNASLYLDERTNKGTAADVAAIQIHRTYDANVVATINVHDRRFYVSESIAHVTARCPAN